MTEFKFFCPQCGQHIQCDTGYSGTQINCPICKQSIVVPQAPRANASAPSPVAEKSRTLQNILVFVAAALVLAGLVIGGWFVYSKISFVPKYEIAGQWDPDHSAEYADVHRHGKHVVFTYNNPGYEQKFEGDYVNENKIVGIQTRTKRADGTVTLMRLTITLQSADSGRADWIALDSNSDLREGQTGMSHLIRVNSLQQ